MKSWGWRLELKYKKLDEDSEEFRRVQGLYDKLKGSLGYSLPGKLRMLDCDKLKAFLLPTGDFYLTTAATKGLSDSEVYGLIAHELAHLQLQHKQEQISYSKPSLLWVKWMSMRDHHTSEKLRSYLVSRIPYTTLQESEAEALADELLRRSGVAGAKGVSCKVYKQ
mmetsp:Transcript_7055/g.12942  ORF Transcript_7055/g.12942 Transcript_7055/m.12942 type:complete len:166 (-) Transcript_7055:2640-3137(-)